MLLAIDPGETTGWALLRHGHLPNYGQIPPVSQSGIKRPNLKWLARLLDKASKLTPQPIVVIERYFLYAWKRKAQTGSSFPTVEVIGLVRYLCQVHGLLLVEQSASQAKTLISDKRLRELGFWIKGRRHTRDAIRHALYYVLIKGRESSS